MTRPDHLTRRRLLLAAVGLLSAGAPPVLAQSPRDQGIGGTGAAPKPNGGDRGIGGTGVIGTIRRFGSIYVNDLRIAYPPDVEVTIDGEPARAADMKIGHVVQTVAQGAASDLRTRKIVIESEVSGALERVSPQTLVVLGQTIDLRGLRQRVVAKVGESVTVFGHRRPNGIIAATLVAPAEGGRERLAGPPTADASGRLTLGGAALRGVPASLAGSRVVMEGAYRDGVFTATKYVAAARPFGSEVQRVSIEAYVDASGRDGAGWNLSGRTRGAGGGLSVLTGRVTGAGAFIIDGGRANRTGLPEGGGPAPVPSRNLPGLHEGPGGPRLPSGGAIAPNLGPGGGPGGLTAPGGAPLLGPGGPVGGGLLRR